MAVNKVVINRDGVETVLVDITDATVTPQTLAQGATAYAKSGEKITGTMQAGIDTSDATATAADILSGKTAYVKGTKVTGNIGTKTASNLTASGATVTVPAGYYASQASKSVSTATQATPSISVNSSGLITASATQTAGYVASGTKQATKQLTTQAAKTVTPSTSEQTAVASGVYTTGAVKVAAIPSSYVQPTGTLSVTENGTHDVKNYASVSVNVENSGGSGGGGSVETCTVTFPAGVEAELGLYSNGEDVLKFVLEETYQPNASIRVAKNSIVFIFLNSFIMEWIVNGDAELVYFDGYCIGVFAVRGDCTIDCM